ncbi:MAG: hypothetical protein ACLPVY_19425 [Acidimicrobiia bacterium]
MFAFAGIGAFASGLFLYLGRRVWFFNDEWDFITTRRAGNFDDLMRPHFGHWSTIPILVYRLLWWTVGLRSYAPYQVLIVALHLAAAWMVRCVMRRSGVRPWIATAAAAILVLFGRGYQDIVWAFQITQVGSLVFGLAHLLLADHDGPLDRRDWIGLAAGTAGMLCSGVAVTMVIVVGIAALVRRGWRIAAIHTVPLGLLYLLWWYRYARGSYSTQGITPIGLARFVAATIVNVFRAVGSFDATAALLGWLLIAGLVLAWRPAGRANWSRQAAAPFALLVGAVVYLVITAFGRAGLPGATHRSRYLDLTLAMLLPALGIAADAVVRRWRTTALAVFAILLIGIPGNVRAIAAYTHNQETKTALFRQTVFLLPRLRDSRLVPKSTEPLPPFTIGWLLDGAASGRIPAPSSITDVERAEGQLRLALRSVPHHPTGSETCRPVVHGIRINLGLGESLRIVRDAVVIAPYVGVQSGYLPLTFGPGVTLSSSLRNVRFRVFPMNSREGPLICAVPTVFPTVR